MGLSDLPDASGEQIVKCLVLHFGMQIARRTQKNHWILVRPGYDNPISIPDHPRVKRPLLAAVLGVVGIGTLQFSKRFRK